MYILKNAWRNVGRSKGRNILIGIIVFIISLSLCIGLSIRQAASSAKDNAMDGMSITAQISVDRSKMMEDFKGQDQPQDGEKPSFDKDSFKGFSNSLSIEEMETYAKASTVQSFYYIITSSLNGNDKFEAVPSSNDDKKEESDSKSEEKSSDEGSQGNENGFPGGSGMPGGFSEATMGNISGNGDFSIIGYSSDEAMTDFVDGNSTIVEGKVFEEDTSEYECIITEELAEYNSISVGDKIKLVNPNNEDESYKLIVVGTYSTTDTVEQGMGRMFSNSDPSNKILMSYTALKDIVDKSAEKSEDDAIFSQTSGTYTFASVDDYNTFTEEVYTLGLSEDYTVSSQDVKNFESSLVPLETLSKIAGYFLIVVLAIGVLILIVLNIFSIRERKYEIGVLTAIGMKKGKVALQFVYEMLIVTLIAVIMGGAVGAITSVPVANALLESQVSAQQQSGSDMKEAFGRDMGDMPNMPGGGKTGGSFNPFNQSDEKSGPVSYVSQISASVNIVVLLELLGICVLLALIASAVSVIFILRYDPLRILSNRD